MHQPAITDATELRGYRQDFAVLKFLPGLSLSLRSQVRGQILGGDNIPTLIATFSRVMCVSTGADVTTTPFNEQSVMASECGRGCGRGYERDFVGGHGSFGGGRGSYSGRQTVGDKGPGSVSTAEGISTSLRSVGKNLVTLNGHN